jgi:hypothetical protein
MKKLYFVLGLIMCVSVEKSSAENYVVMTAKEAQFYSEKVQEYIKTLDGAKIKTRYIDYDIDRDYCLHHAKNIYNTSNLKFCYDLIKEVVDRKKKYDLV